MDLIYFYFILMEFKKASYIEQYIIYNNAIEYVIPRRKKMSRKLARELCMKVLFEMHMNNEFDIKKVEHHLSEEGMEEKQKDYIYGLLNKVIEHLSNIDGIIEEYSKGWKINRIANVDLAILRLALAEILYMEDIPYKVSINEAVELGKTYGSDETPAFINGILGKYVEKEGLKDHEQ